MGEVDDETLAVAELTGRFVMALRAVGHGQPGRQSWPALVASLQMLASQIGSAEVAPFLLVAASDALAEAAQHYPRPAPKVEVPGGG